MGQSESSNGTFLFIVCNYGYFVSLKYMCCSYVGYDRNSSESLFVIPSGYNLTSKQLQVLADEGQRTGLPFYIDDTHAVRPTGKRANTRFSDCQISVRENTIRLRKYENSNIAISFHYDSLVAGEALIFIGAKDFSCKQELK